MKSEQNYGGIISGGVVVAIDNFGRVFVAKFGGVGFGNNVLPAHIMQLIDPVTSNSKQINLTINTFKSTILFCCISLIVN